MREDALLHAGDEDDRVLQALGVVDRHERDEALVVGARVGVGDERDALQEDVERVVLLLGGGVELARDLDELGEVLLAALGLDRALGLQRVDVARVVQQRLEQVADRHALLDALAQPLHRVHEAPQRLDRGGAEARAPARRSAAASQIEIPSRRRTPSPVRARSGRSRAAAS